MTTRHLAAPRRLASWLHRGGRALTLSTVLLTLARAAPAQLISIRTVPVAQGDQFDIFPSQNLAMGGVSIALTDTLLEPFINPAAAVRLGTAYFFGSPTLYSVSNDAGGGRTLPLAGLMKAGDWFGGLALAAQEIDAATRAPTFFPPVPVTGRLDVLPQPVDPGTTQRSHANTYGFGSLGRTLRSAGMSIAASVFLARLNAVDGVDLLYAGSQDLEQSGHAGDVRLGLVKEWDGDRSLQALVLYNWFGMTHDVTYLEWFWDPGTQQPRQRARLEQNLDRTNTWGMHLEYQRPLGQSGWRIGWTGTANRMSHPKIPNYEIMNIPRDPGHSSAFNVGVGISRARGGSTFGIDAIYEPIWSNTWAEATQPIETAGGVIPAGGKTIENDFRFSNAQIRMGVSQELGLPDARPGVALQLGLAIHSIHYRLEQYDNVQAAARSLEESWVEWTPTWGLGLRFSDLEIRYLGRVTKGTGRPSVDSPPAFLTADAVRQSGSIIVAPSGPLTLDEVSVVTHQVSLSIPLR